MSLGKWETNLEDEQSDKRSLYVYLFISRNKDNLNIPGFRERKMSFLAYENSHRVKTRWHEFLKDAKDGELCRMYRTVNKRDPRAIKKLLMIQLVIDDQFDFGHMDGKLAGCAAKKECDAEGKWLFDYDKDEGDTRTVNDFELDIIESQGEDIIDQDYITPHGYGVIVKHGFDTRDLLKKWGDIVTLKRDDMMLLQWETKRSETDE